MDIQKRDDLWVASYITGPTHNRLALRLVEGRPVAGLHVEVLPPIGMCRHHDGLTAEEMIPSIHAGVERANAELGTDFAAEYAEIVADDSRQPPVYELLALRIVQRAASERPPPR